MRFFGAARRADTVGFTLLGLALVVPFAPSIADIIVLLSAAYWLLVVRRRPRLPQRLPASSGLVDHANPDPGTNKPGPAEGIFYLGNDRGTGEEIWLANKECRAHALVLGTTGSGKTETLISMAANALSWGSGLIYVDGKGDTSLWGKVYSLARRFGREDDVLVLNFMTGNRSNLASTHSNTLNPFATGNAAALIELLTSLMSDVGSEGQMWKDRAVALIAGVVRALVVMRDRGELVLDVDVIRNHIHLEKAAELAFRRPDLPANVREALENYLKTLPGFSRDKYEAGEDQERTTNDQHGYLEMQFTRVLGSLADDYGYIFRTGRGEVDLHDVVVNRRILVVLLPALEKSPNELANLGKVVVATLKSMMASTLGSDLEGEWENVIETRPTNSPTPFLTILDEVGYYTVEGMAVMAAQARSLGFSLVFAGQDVAAMEKRSPHEAQSIFGNCNTKIFMKVEDTDRTKQVFTQTVGNALYERMEPANDQMPRTSLTEMERADFLDLKAQREGEAHVVFGDKIVRANLFYANPPPVERLKVNKFLAIDAPDKRQVDEDIVTVDVVCRLEQGVLEEVEQLDDAAEISVMTETMFDPDLKWVPHLERGCIAIARIAESFRAPVAPAAEPEARMPPPDPQTRDEIDTPTEPPAEPAPSPLAELMAEVSAPDSAPEETDVDHDDDDDIEDDTEEGGEGDSGTPGRAEVEPSTEIAEVPANHALTDAVQAAEPPDDEPSAPASVDGMSLLLAEIEEEGARKEPEVTVDEQENETTPVDRAMLTTLLSEIESLGGTPIEEAGAAASSIVKHIAAAEAGEVIAPEPAQSPDDIQDVIEDLRALLAANEPGAPGG